VVKILILKELFPEPPDWLRVKSPYRGPCGKAISIIPRCHCSCSWRCLNLTVDYHKWLAVIYCKSALGYPAVSSHSRINLLTPCTLVSVSEFSSATTHFNHCVLALIEAREGNMQMALLSGGGYFTDLISLYHTIRTPCSDDMFMILGMFYVLLWL